jgi:hypothetical protein
MLCGVRGTWLNTIRVTFSEGGRLGKSVSCSIYSRSTPGPRHLAIKLARCSPAGVPHSANLNVSNLFPVSVVVAKYVSRSS